jgi:SOS-response transcriptional repressor LexA
MQQLNLQQCKVPVISICANSALMDAGLRADQQLIAMLCDWARMKPSRIAKEAGLAATTITRAFNGEATTRISLPTMEKLKARFPDFPQWAADPARVIVSEVAPAGIADPRAEKFGTERLPQIPVVGSAIGIGSFDPQQHVELTELDLGEVLDHVARPASLASDRKAYALTIVGDSMWPRFRPGRRVIVSPRAPASIGDDVIVQLRGDGTDQTADRVTMVLIKELVRRSATFVELRQFNPDVTFRVPAEQVAAIHKVIGEIY